MTFKTDHKTEYLHSGIYIHIPFASKRVITVTFISTSMNRKEKWFWLWQRNPNAQKEFQNDTIETIYFGGGTPSVLTSDEINFLIDSVYENYEVDENQKSRSKPIG
jgi:oxygen-independent coproporphyrinogen-3 oxidase